MTSTWVLYVTYTSGLRHVKTGVQATDLYRVEDVEDLPECGPSSGATVFLDGCGVEPYKKLSVCRYCTKYIFAYRDIFISHFYPTGGVG
jgi:hypothetical protein